MRLRIMSESSLDTRSCDVMKVLESDGPHMAEPPATLDDPQHTPQNNGTHTQECVTDQSSSHQTQVNLVTHLKLCIMGNIFQSHLQRRL